MTGDYSEEEAFLIAVLSRASWDLLGDGGVTVMVGSQSTGDGRDPASQLGRVGCGHSASSLGCKCTWKIISLFLCAQTTDGP